MTGGARSGPTPPHGVAAFAAATAMVLIFAAVCYAVGVLNGDSAPALIFLLPTLAASIWLGFAPALWATLLAFVFSLYFSRIDPHSPLTSDLHAGVFLVVALGILVLGLNAERARERAAANETRWRTASKKIDILIDSARDHAIYTIDTAGMVTTWNIGAERFTGWTEADVLGRHYAIFYPEAAVAAGNPQHDMQQALAEPGFKPEVPRLRKDGSEFIASLSMTRLLDAGGALRGFAIIETDISALRAAENIARQRESDLRAIIANVPEATIVSDEAGKILFFSATAETLFGHAEASVLGTNVSILMPQDRSVHHDDYMARYTRTGEPHIIGIGRTMIGQRKDGSQFPMRLELSDASSGGRRVFISFIQDLTSAQAAEEKIERLQTELTHAARLNAMGTMASTLSHEITQPITAVTYYVEAVRSMLVDPDPEQFAAIREGLDEAAHEALRAGQIVRRLRDFVARGDVDRSVVSLPALINDAASLALLGAREMEVETHFALEPEATPVLVDPVQIQQVIVNLIRNALDAMRGSEQRRLVILSRADGPDHVRVTVEDTGAGIDPELALGLFTAFVTSKEDGMGLGLSICRTIVEAHGGKIWAAAREEGGTAFHFTILRAPADGDDVNDS